MAYIKDQDFTPQGTDKMDGSYDSRNGVRCIRVSPDGKQLASGDRAGNIRFVFILILYSSHYSIRLFFFAVR